MAGVCAIVLLKPETLEAREFARPEIGLDDALLRIEACGICGSDYAPLSPCRASMISSARRR